MTALVETTEEDRMWEKRRKLWDELEERDEELLPELREHIGIGFGSGRLMVHHPLIVDPFYQPGKCGLINHRFRYAQSEAERLLREKNWSAYLFLHAKPPRQPKSGHEGPSEDDPCDGGWDS
jgi:hypothetical protein